MQERYDEWTMVYGMRTHVLQLIVIKQMVVRYLSETSNAKYSGRHTASITEQDRQYTKQRSGPLVFSGRTDVVFLGRTQNTPRRLSHTKATAPGRKHAMLSIERPAPWPSTRNTKHSTSIDAHLREHVRNIRAFSFELR